MNQPVNSTNNKKNNKLLHINGINVSSNVNTISIGEGNQKRVFKFNESLTKEISIKNSSVSNNSVKTSNNSVTTPVVTSNNRKNNNPSNITPKQNAAPRPTIYNKIR